MATYGKKKRSILPSLSALQDSDATTKSKQGASKKLASTAYGMSTSQGRDIAGSLSHHDDSLEEMANMLLEDTTIDQSESDHGQPASHIAAVRMLPSISSQERVLPQLPELHFNRDDAWATNANTVVAAAGNVNEIQPFGGTNGPGNYPEKIFTRSRKGPAPPIPRKSSKRKSARPMAPDFKERAEPGNRQSDGANSKKTKGSISPPKYIDVPQAKPSVLNDTNVSNKIEAMLEATKALKPGTCDHMHQGPHLPTKKYRLKDSNVLMKMKMAINDHIQTRVSKKSYDPARDDYLLHDALNETQTNDKAMSTMEIRMNEGNNLRMPKVSSLTGHGNIRRKAIADDGISLRSRKSVSNDPFSDTPPSNSEIRTPRSFEHRIVDDMSDSTYELPSDSYIRGDKPPRAKRSKQSLLAYDTDFDALLSSSPLAQSTPRIRLEPTFEKNGRAALKNVPADSRSLSDPDASSIGGHYSDVELDPPSTNKMNCSGLADLMKRKSSQVKKAGISSASHYSKRIKKHHSSSKEELEGLERAMSLYKSLDGPSSFNPLDDDSSSKVESELRDTILAPKNPNGKIKEPSRRCDKGKGFGMLLEPDLTRTAVPMHDILDTSRGRTMILKPVAVAKTRSRADGRGNRRYPSRGNVDDDSLMDIDELQWDQTALLKRG